ncbi:MAG: polysaccharide pyruvyl transferase family protein [Ruminococcus sp.]|nr:polysaccharide pyruvyl transferase family protein [Ruminococcus sp.]
MTDAGIEDFLSYIRHARYVVTNSFHGTAFSVQFGHPFISVAIETSSRPKRARS